MNRQLFYRIYWRLQSFIAPSLKYSQAIYEEVLNEHCEAGYSWLDLGCGHRLLPPWRHEQEKELTEKSKLVVGIDYEFLSLTKHKTIKNKVRGDITKLPFQDEAFDLITSNMVFEHLDNPELQLKEISRVLKKGGKLIFHTPNTLGYGTIMARITPEAIKAKLIFILEGRKAEDVFPTYFRINSPSRIRKLAKSSGFQILKIKMICSSAQFIVLPPLVFLELLWIKLLMTKNMKPFRTNIIAILKKA